MQGIRNKGRIINRFHQSLAGVFLMLLLGNYNPYLLAQECRAQTELVTDFHLCESSHTGKRELYSCRDYRQDSILYRAYYKGGRTPKALATVAQESGWVKLNRIEPMGRKHMNCDISPPEGIPQDVIYLGSGVCEDRQEQPVPCSLYKQAAARQPARHAARGRHPADFQTIRNELSSFGSLKSCSQGQSNLLSTLLHPDLLAGLPTGDVRFAARPDRSFTHKRFDDELSVFQFAIVRVAHLDPFFARFVDLDSQLHRIAGNTAAGQSGDKKGPYRRRHRELQRPFSKSHTTSL